jgi:hypothetical protein
VNWVDAVLFVVLTASIAAAVFVGIVIAARSPAVWGALGTAIASQFIPKFIAYIVKRNPPDIEAKMQECIRRGGEWDNFNKRCK